MVRSSFRRKTLDEVKSKHATKRAKMPLGASKRAKSTKVPSKVKSLAKWKKELDVIFSKYIRQRDNGQCFTCPKKDDPKRMQNGHFVPRQYLAVRFNEKNCNCQCYACNMLYGGQGATYAIRLKEKYGQETVEWLESQRWVSFKPDADWYKEQIAIYTQKYNDLCTTN